MKIEGDITGKIKQAQQYFAGFQAMPSIESSVEEEPYHDGNLVSCKTTKIFTRMPLDIAVGISRGIRYAATLWEEHFHEEKYYLNDQGRIGGEDFRAEIHKYLRLDYIDDWGDGRFDGEELIMSRFLHNSRTNNSTCDVLRNDESFNYRFAAVKASRWPHTLLLYCADARGRMEERSIELVYLNGPEILLN